MQYFEINIEIFFFKEIIDQKLWNGLKNRYAN